MSEPSLSIGIVGGGILGTVVALTLRDTMPDSRVFVYDKNLRGSGASRFSAGVHFPYGRSEHVRTMTRMSENFYATHHAVKKSPAIVPVKMEVVSQWDEGELQQFFTHQLNLASDPYHNCKNANQRSYTCEGGQYADVYGLVNQIADHISPNTSIREGIAVKAIDETQDKISLHLADGSHAMHDAVILAPGPWSNNACWAEFTKKNSLRIKRVAALHISDSSLIQNTPLVFFPDEDAFLLPKPNRGEWLFSYTNNVWDQSPDHDVFSLTADDLRQGYEVLEVIAPELIPKITGGRVFCDTYSSDYVPCVKEVGHSGRLIYAGAANGSGYRLAPAMAQAAVQLIAKALSQSHLFEEAE